MSDYPDRYVPEMIADLAHVRELHSRQGTALSGPDSTIGQEPPEPRPVTDTTPTPNDLLTRIAEASRAGRVEELRSIVNELPVPTPPPSTLRIIDIAMCERTIDRDRFRTTRTTEFDPAYIDHIAAQPDPMTVIEQTVESFLDAESGARADLVARIRGALEGATQ